MYGHIWIEAEIAAEKVSCQSCETQNMQKTNLQDITGGSSEKIKSTLSKSIFSQHNSTAPDDAVYTDWVQQAVCREMHVSNSTVCFEKSQSATTFFRERVLLIQSHQVPNLQQKDQSIRRRQCELFTTLLTNRS